MYACRPPGMVHGPYRVPAGLHDARAPVREGVVVTAALPRWPTRGHRRRWPSSSSASGSRPTRGRTTPGPGERPGERGEDPGLDREVRGARDRRLGDRPPPVGARALRQRLARAAQRPLLRGRADHARQAGHGHPGAAGPASGDARQGDLDALPPLPGPLPVRRGPGLVRARVRGDGHPDRGAREADRRAHRGGAPAALAAERDLPRPLLPLRRRDDRSEAPDAARGVGLRRIARPGPRRARRAEARHDGGGADRSGGQLDLAMLGQAGMGEAGLGGSAAPRRAHGPGSRRPWFSGTATSPISWRRRSTSARWRRPGRRSSGRWGRTAAGSTCRSATWWDPSTGSTPASPTSCPSGMEYMVLGPVSDDPRQIDLMAKHVMPAFA